MALEARWQKIMIEGDRAFRQGNFAEAIDYFSEAINVAESILRLAEAAHALARTYLKIGNAFQFLESEKFAAKCYESIDIGQSADFMKFAGDMLLRLKKPDLANEAYLLAAQYFNDQSVVEEDVALKLAWKGWSCFCYGKRGDAPVTNFRKAAEYFSQAANNSKSEALKNNRTAKAYLATALSVIFDSNLKLEERVQKSRENFENALNLERDNRSYKACFLITDTLSILAEFQANKMEIASFFETFQRNLTFLKETLNLMENTSFLINELNEILRDIQFKSTFDSSKIFVYLIEILKAVS